MLATASENSDRRQQFIDAMAKMVSSVVVVTTDGPAGRAGLTVSALSSVSADGPNPTLLVCVHHLSPAADAIIENQRLCANLLGSHQSSISDCFAGRHPAADADGKTFDKFDCGAFSTMASGAPALDGALANFDCRLIENTKVSTHHIFICEVVAVRMGETAPVLAYSNRDYCSVLPGVSASH